MPNNFWVQHPVYLTGETVDLRPLEKEYFPEVIALANDKRIWEFYPYDGTNPERMQRLLNGYLVNREEGHEYPFVIFHKKENKIIGCTHLRDMVPAHRKLEIGSTWLHPGYWKTRINSECKRMLLQYCFETLGTLRVMLRANDKNIRSRKAIEKIGAKFEGLIRNEILHDNGYKRTSAYYSIIDEEWPEVNIKLDELIKSL